MEEVVIYSKKTVELQQSFEHEVIKFNIWVGGSGMHL